MKNRLTLSIKSRLIGIICISVFIGYLALQYLLMLRSGFDSQLAFKDSLINSAAMMFCCYGMSSALNFYTPQPREIWKVLIIGLIMAAISTGLSRFLMNYFIQPNFITLLDLTLPFRGIVNFLILTSVAIINIVWNIQEDNINNIKRKQESENLLREAELYNLRQQLQPHFLFNSLNSIIALIGANPDEARNMTFQLSDFLRGTMRKENNQIITLEEELDHLQLYLDIEKVRFGHRLNTSISSSEEIFTSKLPAMIIQPLVENAIKHGLYNITDQVDIQIKCTSHEGQLHIQITNPFDVEEQSKPKKGTGFGLSSIQRRLYLLYGRNDLLETQIQDNIFTSTLKIPQYD